MNATPGQAPVKSVMPKWVRGPQDFVGGIALMAIALFALWASSDLQGMRGFSFGAGTAPRMFGFLLLGLGAAVAARRRFDRRRSPCEIPLAGSSVCVAGDPVVCLHDPADGNDLRGHGKLHHRGMRNTGDPVDGNADRRRLPDGVLRPFVSLRARSAFAAPADFHDPLRARWEISSQILGSASVSFSSSCSGRPPFLAAPRFRSPSTFCCA